MDEVEFTPEELAMVEGSDLEEEVRPRLDDYGDSVATAVPDVVEGEVILADPPAEEKPVLSEVEQLQRANAGLLSDLRDTRRGLKEAKEWRHGIESRLEFIASQKKEGEEVASDDEPDREEDPVGWLEWKGRKNVETQLEPVIAKQEEEVRNKEAADAEMYVFNTTSASQAAYIEKEGLEEGQFNERLGQIRENRLKWHIAAGMDPATAVNILQQEERAFLYDAVSRGEDPASEAMKLWSMMIGDGNATTGAVVPKDTSAPATFDKVEAAKRGKTTAGLGDVPGGASGTRITFQQFSELEEGDPIAEKIYSNPRLLQKISVHGEVVV